ncbi:24901_t:CDS:2 [Cetraspora pellucida]|uniref:24901_t:CDS:1 n=1 Tax=Cetraspora pellucida TaxID=1433469 RepID=A0A9N9HIC1_9GLOM|nr:24901_t:CDS:2 [Cetraspora pellucida]
MSVKKQNISEQTTSNKNIINNETMNENFDNTKVICQEPSISKILKEKTPNIAKLFKKNPIATLKFLTAIGKKHTSNLNFEISEETPKDLFFENLNNNDDNQLLNSINVNVSKKFDECYDNTEKNFEINMSNFIENEENYVIWKLENTEYDEALESFGDIDEIHFENLIEYSFIFVAKKHAENISLTNEFDKNTEVKGFYYHDTQYYNKKTENETISGQAQKYAEYLARNKIYDHIPSARKKIKGMYWLENLGCQHETEEQAIKSWMNSSGHKRQIISKDYIYFGAGFAKDIWVQAFGMKKLNIF